MKKRHDSHAAIKIAIFYAPENPETKNVYDKKSMLWPLVHRFVAKIPDGAHNYIKGDGHVLVFFLILQFFLVQIHFRVFYSRNCLDSLFHGIFAIFAIHAIDFNYRHVNLQQKMISIYCFIL